MTRFPFLRRRIGTALLGLALALSFGTADGAQASSDFGPTVDAFCSGQGRGTPYADLIDPAVFFVECTLCHDSSFPAVLPNSGNARAAESAAWDAGNYGFFCPAANQPPVLAAIGAKMGTEGQALAFTVTATDPDAGDTLSLTATPLPSGASFTDNGDGTGSFAWTPAVGQANIYSVTFSVSDGSGTAMETVSITIFNANQAPVLAPIGNQSVNEGGTLSLTLSASDPDGDPLTLTAGNLPTGASFNDAGNGTAAFSWTPAFDQAGSFSVNFTAADNGTPPLSDAESITITVGDVNRPPALVPIGNQGVNEGDTLALTISASDPDGDGLSLAAANLASGAAFADNGDGTASFSWTPGFGQTGNFDVTFSATDDGAPPATASETITISVGDVNRAPLLTPIGNQTVNEGVALQLTVMASDPDGDALTLQASGLPQGATFTDAGNGTGSFAWTPGFAQSGNHVVSFTAMDGGTPVLNATESITITVGDVNRPPVLAAIGDRSVNEGELLQFAVSATDPDGNGLVLQLANAPLGAALQDNGDGTGTLAWTPGFGEAGNYAITISATDDGAPVAQDQETLTITVGDVNRPPTVAPIGNHAANTNQLVAFQVSATDPDGDAVSCAVSGAPAGSSFVDNGDGTGNFSWTPGAADVGSHTMTITATDAGSPVQTASETVTVAVGLVNNAPTIVMVGDRTVLPGQTLSFSVLATDVDGNGLGFTASGVPAGASFTDNGDGTSMFSWTPGATNTGSVVVTFTVTDDGIPAMSDQETVKIAIQGVASGFGISDATWWDTWKGQLVVTGAGASAGSTVEIIDADTGLVVGTVIAAADGTFTTGQCRTIKRRRGKKRRRVIRECLLPIQAPCEVQVRSGANLGLRTPVTNSVLQCGNGSPTLLQGSAVLKRMKRKRHDLMVVGDHALANQDVEIRDAETDALLQTVTADASGRFSWTDIRPAAVPCFVRLAAANQFSDPIPVQRKRKGKRGMRQLCPDPVSFPPPGPTASGGNGGAVGGNGGTGGGSGSGSGSGSGNTGGGNAGGGNTGGGNTGGGSGGGVDPVEQAMIDAFSQTVHPLNTQYCASCHDGSTGIGRPDIAHPDPTSAYRATYLTQKVNLTQPYASRLVQRLADGHFCWGDCADDAETMRAAIAMWAVLVGNTGNGGGQQSVTSGQQTMADGVEGGGNLRYDDAVIARWEFKEGTGNIARDTSGVMPALDLSLAGVDWLGGGGIEIKSGRAVASQMLSRKLYDELADPTTGTQEYSIEAWVFPEKIDQRGPARILTYSVDPYNRNFMLGQQNYQYAARNRSRASGISSNGTPTLYTDDDDRDLATELQHVVMTFDQTNGRRVYVNGVWTDDVDRNGGGTLDNWNPSYRFAIGNELTNNRLWKGKVYFAAIHERALTPAEILSHALAGFEERFLLRFDVSQWTGQAGSVIEMTVSDYDPFSYLFSHPTYVGPTGAGIAIRNLRIMVNGQVPVAGQAFRSIDTVASQSPQALSSLGSVIAKDQGPANDVFSIAFEVLGDNTDVVIDNDAPVVPGGFTTEVSPETGLRNFDQINDTMSVLTGVPKDTGSVERTFEGLTQQLPGSNDLRGFVSAHQVGAFKLGIEYCDRMVESRTLRENLFGTGFRFGADTFTAFQDPSAKQLIADRLVERFYGTGLADQPDTAQTRPHLVQLIDDLTTECTSPAACDREHTQSVVKAACTAVISSGPVLFH